MKIFFKFVNHWKSTSLLIESLEYFLKKWVAHRPTRTIVVQLKKKNQERNLKVKYQIENIQQRNLNIKIKLI